MRKEDEEEVEATVAVECAADKAGEVDGSAEGLGPSREALAVAGSA